MPMTLAEPFILAVKALSDLALSNPPAALMALSTMASASWAWAEAGAARAAQNPTASNNDLRMSISLGERMARREGIRLSRAIIGRNAGGCNREWRGRVPLGRLLSGTRLRVTSGR